MQLINSFNIVFKADKKNTPRKQLLIVHLSSCLFSSCWEQNLEKNIFVVDYILIILQYMDDHGSPLHPDFNLVVYVISLTIPLFVQYISSRLVECIFWYCVRYVVWVLNSPSLLASLCTPPRNANYLFVSVNKEVRILLNTLTFVIYTIHGIFNNSVTWELLPIKIDLLWNLKLTPLNLGKPSTFQVEGIYCGKFSRKELNVIKNKGKDFDDWIMIVWVDMYQICRHHNVLPDLYLANNCQSG